MLRWNGRFCFRTAWVFYNKTTEISYTESTMEAQEYEVDPWELYPWSQHILAAADFMQCCSFTHRNDSSASVEPVLSTQKTGASLVLQTYLPREGQVCVTFVCTYCVGAWMCMFVCMYVTSTMEHNVSIGQIYIGKMVHRHVKITCLDTVHWIKQMCKLTTSIT